MPNPIHTIHHLFQSIIDRQPDQIIACYDDSPTTYVFVEGPRWSTLGHERIAEGWRAFVNAPLAIQSCTWTEGPFSQVAGEMAWIAGIVELVVRVGDHEKSVHLRGTFVLRRHENDTWRIIHEHFSQPAADPYGIGDWLHKA